jgi:hypothetical protein
VRVCVWHAFHFATSMHHIFPMLRYTQSCFSSTACKLNRVREIKFLFILSHWTASRSDCFFLYKTPVVIIMSILNYLLVPYNRVLPEKLTVSQLVKNYPEFRGTRKFITAFTRACHLSLSRARRNIVYQPLSMVRRHSIILCLGGSIDSIDVAQCTNRWRAFVKVVMKFRVL